MTVPTNTVVKGTEVAKPPRFTLVKRAYRLFMRPLRKPLASGYSFATPGPVALFGWGAFILIVICNVYAMVRSFLSIEGRS